MRARFDGTGRPDLPLLPAASGIALGVAAVLVLPAATGAWLAVALIGCGPQHARLRLFSAGALAGVVLAAAAAATQPSARRPLPLPGWYDVEGRVRSAIVSTGRMQRFLLAADRLGSEPAAWPTDLLLRVTLWRGQSRGGDLPALEPGCRVRLTVRLAPPSTRAHRVLRAHLPDARALRRLPSPGGLSGELRSLRRRAADCFHRHLEPRDAGLARALLLGDRSALAREDRQSFRTAGQAHLLAVSGIHVGLLLAGLIFAAGLIGVPLRATWLLGLAAAAVYVPFTGAPPSAVRAGCAAAVYFLGRLLDRPPRSLAVLTLVAAVILVVNPLAVRDVSFQLSFAAVIGILTLGPKLYDAAVPPRPDVPGVVRRRAPVRGALCVAVAAWLGTAPVVAIHIGRLCPAGALLSVPAIPLAASALACGFGVLITAPMPAVAALPAHGFGLATSALRTLLDAAAHHGLGTLPVAAPSPAWIAAYVAAFALGVRASGRWAWIGRGLLPLLLLPLFLTSDPASTERAAPGSADGGEYHAPAPPMHHPVFPHPLAEPLGLALLAASLALFAFLSVWPLGWLTRGGAAAAGILGTAAGWRFGWAGLAAVFAPFTVATLLSKLPGRGRSGPRRLVQVVCNGLPALVGAALAAAGLPAEGLAFFLGSLACLGSDTCATEIGVRFGRRVWRLVGNRPIERGESGAVSHLGQFAALGGALLAPLAYASVAGTSWIYVGALTATGMAGSLIDSALGGTLQYRGIHPDSGHVVEALRVDGRRTERYSGVRWLTNDTVNLASGSLAGAIGVVLAGLI